jgi:hypothetical protein
MTEQIKMGAILIEGKTCLPDSLLFESERVSNGWILVRNIDRYRLERRIRDAGWAFLAGREEFKAGVFGFNVEKTTRRALHQVVQHLKSETFNCLEVTEVAINRFLGLPHVSISARPHCIRQSAVAVAPSLSAV